MAQIARNQTISERLADYVTGMKIGDLPSEVVDKTKLCILDTIGCMLAGSRDEVGVRITAHALRYGPPGPCTVFGHLQSLGPEHAALANGTLAHVLEWDDGHRPSGNHMGGVVVPAALAMAQAIGASAPELLLSVTLGYDVMGRVGEAVCLPRNVTPFHGNGTVGVFGAAAAAGRLLGLNAGQLANALGIAGDGASGLREFPRPNGMDCKPLHVGRAAQTGITAVLLAAEGFQGPDTILEGRAGFCAAMTPEARLELICLELGQRFAVLESGFKVHACMGQFTAIDAALWLRKEYNLDPASIRRIKIAMPDSARINDPVRKQQHPSNVGNARYSIPFTVAAAFIDGEVTHRQISRTRLADPVIAALAERVEFVSDPEVEAIFGAQKRDEPYFHIPLSVEVECGGHSYRRLERTPFGYDPQQRGLTQAQAVGKFLSMVDGVLSETQTDGVVDWVLGLDNESIVAHLSSLFT